MAECGKKFLQQEVVNAKAPNPFGLSADIPQDNIRDFPLVRIGILSKLAILNILYNKLV